MLFIIDMQNDYVDSDRGSSYVKDAEMLVPGIINKIKYYEERGDKIFYTSDINLLGQSKGLSKLQYESDNNNDKIGIINRESMLSTHKKWCFQPYGDLKPLLKKHQEIKKSYYAIPPETLLEIQLKFKDEKQFIENIEFVGVETIKCLLANAICVQSAFPEANIIVDAKLCKSKDKEDHEYALKVMESLGMEIRR